MAVGLGDEDVVGDRLAQGVAQRARLQPAGLRQHVLLERCAAETQRSTSCAVSPSASTRSISASRSARAARRALAPGGEQLLGEQRVALAAGVDAVEQLGVGRRAEDVGQLRAELVAA